MICNRARAREGGREAGGMARVGWFFVRLRPVGRKAKVLTAYPLLSRRSIISLGVDEPSHSILSVQFCCQARSEYLLETHLFCG